MLPASLYILLLIAALDSNHFAVREQAHEALAVMGDAALLALALADRRPHSAEQAFRVRRLIDARRPAMVARLLERHERVPRIDALPDDFRLGTTNRYGVIEIMFARLSSDGCEEYDPDADSSYRRRATRELVLELVYAGRAEAELVAILDAMAKCEADGKCHWSQD